jgi:flagellar motor switch protein FliM
VSIGIDVPPSSVSELRTKTRSRTGNRDSVVTYDFRHPTKLSREHVRLLQMAYETFARRLTTVLTSGLRQVCLVTVTDITQQSYDEYVNSLATPTLMVPVQALPLAGTGVLELSLPVALAAIDHMLGGPGGNQPNRSLTDIETTLLDGLLEQILSALRYAMESIVVLEFQSRPIEYNPQFLQAASAADPVVVGEFDLAIGEQRCRLTLCLPLGPLLPVLTHRPREATQLGADAATKLALRDRLSELDMEVTVRFRSVQLSPARILELAVGDVVVLDHRVGGPLSIEVGGAPIAYGVAGKSGQRLAALVVDNPVLPSKER